MIISFPLRSYKNYLNLLETDILRFRCKQCPKGGVLVPALVALGDVAANFFRSAESDIRQGMAMTRQQLAAELARLSPLWLTTILASLAMAKGRPSVG
jgi:hypothetical protein